MKTKINIEFQEVSGHKVDEKMINDKKFKKSTEKTIAELCKQIEKYFSDFNIKVKISYKI